MHVAHPGIELRMQMPLTQSSVVQTSVSEQSAALRQGAQPKMATLTHLPCWQESSVQLLSSLQSVFLWHSSSSSCSLIATGTAARAPVMGIGARSGATIKGSWRGCILFEGKPCKDFCAGISMFDSVLFAG